MLTERQIETFLNQYDPLESALKYAYEHEEDIRQISEERGRIYKEIILESLRRYNVSNKLYKISGHEQWRSEIENDAAYVNGMHSNNMCVNDMRSHMTHADYALESGKNISIIRHGRYTPPGLHDHEFIELSYVFSGHCHHDFSIGGQMQPVELKEGELVIIPPGVTHQIAVFDDSVILNILVNRHTFENVFLQELPSGNLLYQFFWKMIFMQEESSYLVFRETDREQLKRYVLQLIMEYVEEETYGQKVCEHLLGILFLKLIENAKETTFASNLPKEAARIAPMIVYIQKNYRKLTLEEIAAEFHYSQANLNRVFKKYTGTTIGRYIKEQRLRQAENLLNNSQFSVEEIAVEVGYEDISYFIGQFKNFYGMTPLQYRKKQTDK